MGRFAGLVFNWAQMKFYGRCSQTIAADKTWSSSSKKNTFGSVVNDKEDQQNLTRKNDEHWMVGDQKIKKNEEKAEGSYFEFSRGGRGCGRSRRARRGDCFYASKIPFFIP